MCFSVQKQCDMYSVSVGGGPTPTPTPTPLQVTPSPIVQPHPPHVQQGVLVSLRLMAQYGKHDYCQKQLFFINSFLFYLLLGH